MPLIDQFRLVYRIGGSRDLDSVPCRQMGDALSACSAESVVLVMEFAAPDNIDGAPFLDFLESSVRGIGADRPWRSAR